MYEEPEHVTEESGMQIAVVSSVPGSGDSLTEKKLLSQNDLDVLVVLGIIEPGETRCGVIMGQAVTDVLIDLRLDLLKPIGVGVLGPSQSPGRLRPYVRAATEAVHHMLLANEASTSPDAAWIPLRRE